MINARKAILQYDRPEIILDELSTMDLYKAGDPNKVEASRDKQEIHDGALMPLIHINSYLVKDISYLKIDMNSEIPELLIVFRINETRFLFTSYPKDGDLLCLFIRSQSELYKPIRHDYTIVEVKSSDPGAVNGMPEAHKSVSEDYTFVIKAQLRIPKIFQHSCKSYSQKTSWDVLRNLAKELKLGFSSNEKSTNDVMTWICPNISNEHFISEVVNSSWKSEEDSFEWWVDPYYNLTFVNMNKQLFGPDSRGVDYEVVRMQMGTGQEITGGFNSNQKAGDEEIPLILTNEPYRSKYPFFITNYKVENNSGYVVNKFGYKTILQFYDTSLVSDSPKNKYSKYAIESLTPKDFNDGEIILRGRPNEKIYQDEYKKEWLGTKYFENTHTNIHQAPKQNLLNKVENYKIILQIELNSYVPWIYRGQLIPVHIVHGSSFDAAGQKGPALANAAEKPGESVLNRFLSGKYIILGTSIEFKDAKLKTILRLGKMQWTINDGIASIPEPLTT
jgi:hypothetical protein